ncbi:uncharacterized protein G2W53_007867 [Senna tora]|uniref:Uncharacterized protein n=1 Tax=Senna tora TaxID=362788 RepID=A0A835CG85_9FABA|nr:uncharacterized protein G2W53_007867 [Senna tora]
MVEARIWGWWKIDGVGGFGEEDGWKSGGVESFWVVEDGRVERERGIWLWKFEGSKLLALASSKAPFRGPARYNEQ